MHKRMVIFDFDGVICDSWWLTHKTSEKMYPGLTEDEHKTGFEGNIFETEKSFTQEKSAAVDFETEYQKEMHLVAFFKVEEVIRKLSGEYLLAIVSSSWNRIIESYLEREGLRGCFIELLGGDTHRSKHVKINMLLEKYSLSAKDCVMVTDTSGDVREAAMAGVDSIGVSWGFHETHRLEKVKTFRIIHDPKELEPAIGAYFSAQSDIIS